MGKTAAQHIGDIRTAHKKTVRDIVQRIAYAFGNLGQAAFYNTMSTFFHHVCHNIPVHQCGQVACRAADLSNHRISGSNTYCGNLSGPFAGQPG